MSEDENNSTSEGNALNAVQFKGRCHNCGKYGHKGANCRNKTYNGSNGNHKGGTKTNGKSGGFKGNCNHGKKYGHKVVDCYTKKKEQGKEQAKNAVGGKKQDKEVILLALEEKDLENYEDLKDYNDLEEAEVSYTIDALRENNQENIVSDNVWDLGEPYIKRWGKYSTDGKFLGWKVCLVQDILPTEEIEDDELYNEVLLCSTEFLCSTEDEGQDGVEPETREFLTKIALS
jgi:hypothetical protein